MSTTFRKEEKAAMRAAAEAKAAQQGADLEAACLVAIEEMGTVKELAETLHQLVKKHTTYTGCVAG